MRQTPAKTVSTTSPAMSPTLIWRAWEKRRTSDAATAIVTVTVAPHSPKTAV